MHTVLKCINDGNDDDKNISSSFYTFLLNARVYTFLLLFFSLDQNREKQTHVLFNESDKKKTEIENEVNRREESEHDLLMFCRKIFMSELFFCYFYYAYYEDTLVMCLRSHG